jgi:glycosyltransferase involved in cell wall biosynthesis
MSRPVLFFYATNVVGGAETNIIKIARELVICGYNVHLAFLSEEGPLLSQLDFRVSSITCIGDFRKHPIAAYKRYKQLIRTEKIDVVFNFGLKVECFSRMLSRRFGCQKVISCIRSSNNNRKWGHTFLDRLTQYNVDLWTSNSEAGKKAHHDREKFPLEKIKVIYNFIEEVSMLPKQQSDFLKIGTLANITQQKGYFDMIPLAKLLLKKGMNFRFIVGGVDRTNEVFFNEIKKELLESFFEFRGYVSDKPLFFSEIDVFFLPSYREGLPTVLLEAAMYGTPIVASNIDGIPEIIQHNQTGYLYNPGDIIGYAEGFEELANPKKRAFFAEKASAFVKENFSKEDCMEKWIKIINEV